MVDKSITFTFVHMVEGWHHQNLGRPIIPKANSLNSMTALGSMKGDQQASLIGRLLSQSIWSKYKKTILNLCPSYVMEDPIPQQKMRVHLTQTRYHPLRLLKRQKLVLQLKYPILFVDNLLPRVLDTYR